MPKGAFRTFHVFYFHSRGAATFRCYPKWPGHRERLRQPQCRSGSGPYLLLRPSGSPVRGHPLPAPPALPLVATLTAPSRAVQTRCHPFCQDRSGGIFATTSAWSHLPRIVCFDIHCRRRRRRRCLPRGHQSGQWVVELIRHLGGNPLKDERGSRRNSWPDSPPPPARRRCHVRRTPRGRNSN